MKIDARGIACPQPVLMMKDALEKIEEGVVTILVDNKGSSINIKNFCESNGHTVSVKEKDGCFSIDVAKGFDCVIAEEQGDSNIVTFISGECLGNEEPELGKMLMKGFLSNIKNLDQKPRTVIFVNNGVRMLTTNEETVAIVKELADIGIEILVCGACLEYFQLVDYLKVGVISDAYTVSNKLFNADKVVKL